ncbi:MAG: hypothetical protein V4726_21105 [Verrucomicrobiota bacterium]
MIHQGCRRRRLSRVSSSSASASQQQRQRQRHGLSHAAFSGRIGLKQRTWAAYGTATRRKPSSLLLPVPRLQRQLDQVTRLPRAKQKFVSGFPGTVLQAAG